MKGKTKYLLFRWATGIFMMLMLVWLTVSAPFVTGFQLQVAAQEKSEQAKSDDQTEDNNNPFANTTEEKTESGSLSFSEEYLHEHHDLINSSDDLLKHDNCGHSALYIAFHGELLSPPPEV